MMRNILLFIFCGTLWSTGFSQESPDYKKVEYGILMQANFGYLNLEQTDWASLGIENEINSLEAQNRFGFGLGILGKFNISRYLAIVPQPTIYFQQNQVAVDLENQANYEEEIKPVAIAIPIHLVFTNCKWEKWNPSAALGARYVHGFSDPSVSSQIALQNHDFAIDFGAGVEVKFDRFKMKPELLFSKGLTNLKRSNNRASLVDTVFESIHQDQIAFRVLFYN
ncbi:MAG: hypothetical protein AAF985_07790 [Bacteroidota bacterium]